MQPKVQSDPTNYGTALEARVQFPFEKGIKLAINTQAHQCPLAPPYPVVQISATVNGSFQMASRYPTMY